MGTHTTRANAMSAVVRGDALRLPLADETVDLIVTSPPYFALRSYRDGGEHYDGQIGSEPTPAAFIEALLAVTAECVRVLKPTGSMFVNLGDKYAGSGGHNNGAYGTSGLHKNRARSDSRDAGIAHNASLRNAPNRYNQESGGARPKSLMLLPERYRIGCVDQLGLIARAVIVWNKPNGLPESVTDRVRRSHEDWVHVTKEGRYYSAVDEIREPHKYPLTGDEMAARLGGKKNSVIHGGNRGAGRDNGESVNTEDELADCTGSNPLGKLPGSVWTIPTEPLVVPDWLDVDHFAAFPQEWPRRLILGWSPPGICVECDEGRRPVVANVGENRGVRGYSASDDRYLEQTQRSGPGSGALTQPKRLTGYACECDKPTAPTRPAVVLDPFGGTGTTAMVARALGRTGISVDLSADYCRLARWRIFQSGHAAKTRERTNREAQGALL